MHPIAALAPEEDCEVWRINEAYRADEYYGRNTTCDRWFQLHQRWDFTRRQNRSVHDNWKDHWEWLRQEHGFPIYMQEEYDDIPNSVRFPLSEIIDEFGLDSHTTYFRNTLALCVAFATFLGFEKIGIYGWELSSDTESKYEKPSALFWLGIAKGMGIEIELPPGSALLGHNQRIYAFDDVPAVNRMHVESSQNSAEREMYKLMTELRIDPDNRDTRDQYLVALGQSNAYKQLMAELDDVQDPRGNFDEEDQEA